jgi:hypothetical protein
MNVRNQRRQIEISPGTKAEDRKEKPEPGIDEPIHGGQAGNSRFRIETKDGVGMITPICQLSD